MPVKDDVQCLSLEYLTDVGGVVFEGTGVEWMVGCVYSEAWNKHGKASVSNHKQTYTQTEFKTNIYIRYENNTGERYARKTFLNTHTHKYTLVQKFSRKVNRQPTNQPKEEDATADVGFILTGAHAHCSSSCFSSFFLTVAHAILRTNTHANPHSSVVLCHIAAQLDDLCHLH